MWFSLINTSRPRTKKAHHSTFSLPFALRRNMAAAFTRRERIHILINNPKRR
jgi:hypothetical protein